MYSPTDPMYRQRLAQALMGRKQNMTPMGGKPLPTGQQPYAAPQTQYPAYQKPTGY